MELAAFVSNYTQHPPLQFERFIERSCYTSGQRSRKPVEAIVYTYKRTTLTVYILKLHHYPSLFNVTKHKGWLLWRVN